MMVWINTGLIQSICEEKYIYLVNDEEGNIVMYAEKKYSIDKIFVPSK